MWITLNCASDHWKSKISTHLKQMITVMEHQMRITMIAKKMIMITMKIQMTISMHGNRFHFSLRWHRIHQFIVSFSSTIIFFKSINLKWLVFIIFKNSAAIENDCGNWSSITWSWNWIWLHGRSCSCPGWTKSITHLKIDQTEKTTNFLIIFSIFFLLIEWCTSVVCAGKSIYFYYWQ